MEVVRTLQDAPTWLTDLAGVVTVLGDQEFYLLVLPLVYWSVSRRVGLQLVAVLLLSAGVNAVLKLGFTTPRPGFLAPELAVVEATGYGVPSGHSQNAVVVWGVLASQLRSRRWWLGAALLAIALGWSRLQVGAHFPVDVVTGLAVGGVMLVAYLRFATPAEAWLRRRTPGELVGVALALSLALVGVGVALRLTVATGPAPSSWVGVDPVAPPFDLDAVVTPAATLLGVVLGVALLWRRGGFGTEGHLWQRLLRYGVGIVGVLVLEVGLGVDDVVDDARALLRHAGQYALIGLWIAGLAPLLFVRLGIAPAGDDDRWPLLRGSRAGARGGPTRT